MCGSFVALAISQQSLNIFSMIGLTLLVGLVAKNSILLIDLANQLRAKGMAVDAALAEANLRSKIGVHVMGLKDVMKGKFEMFPDGKTKLLEDQVLLVVGRETEIAALRELP